MSHAAGLAVSTGVGGTGSVTVLLVDDDSAYADLVATQLERQDDRLSVETAASASEGLERLADGGVDCVVSDYEMPGRDGIEFLEEVRTSCPDLPFVLHTGKGGEEVASEAVSAGVTDYLRKDSGTDQYALLANRVCNYVERDRIRRERERHLDAIETAQEGISILDQEGRFVYVNRVYADLYGYEPAEMVGEHWELVYPDEDVERVREEAIPEAETTGNWHGTTTGLRADGTTFVEDHRLATTDRGELICTVRDVTEEEERERELQRQRDRFDTLFENLPNPVVRGRVVDGEPVIAQVNPAFEETFGYDAEAVVGKPFDEVTVPEGRHEEPSDIVDRLLDEGPVRTEVKCQTADDVRDFVIDAVIHDERDDAVEGYAIYTDITERKERERELARTGERIRLALAGSRSWLWEFDLETGTTTQSAVTGLLGVDGDEVTRPVEDFLEQVHPEDRHRIVANDPPTEPGEQYHAEFRLLVDDEVRWIESRGQFYPGDGDTSDRVIGIARDVTERRKREEELRVAEYILESAPDGINVVGLDGEIRDANAKFLEMWGYESVDEVTGLPVTEKWADPEDAQEARRTMKETGSWSGELRARRADGTTFPAQCKMSLVTDEDGTPLARMGIFRDITDQTERERELERQNERLEEFAGIVSHDLRNPLQVARGRLELVRGESDSEQLAAIDQAHERMESLIEKLLELTREGDGAADVEPVPLADAVESCWHTVETKGATVAVETDATVRADSSRLRQLLENLVRNAVEHGSTSPDSHAPEDAGRASSPESSVADAPEDAVEHGGANVTVTVGDLADGFYVADDGPGIPEDERDQVFEPGYSTDETGTGLGLAIVADVARAHDWDVRVTESDAGGARFEVTGVEIDE